MIGLEWLLVSIAVIAACAAMVGTVVAVGLVLSRLGVATGQLLAHLSRCLRGLGSDLVRAVGGMTVAVLLLPVALARVCLLRGRSAREALATAGGEFRAAFRAIFSAVIVRPLEFLGLGSVVQHVGSRLPAALGESRVQRPHTAVARVNFDGFRVLRELQRGGSGARLFVAEPDDRTRRRIELADGFVVIKCFDFDEGTHLAEVLRESRSLEAARKLGLVLDHAATERRFYYVMRYIEGIDLGKFTRRLHEAAGDAPLDRTQIALAAAFVRDMVATLRDWHAAGLLHKDIKPENTIVHEGRATLVDLGLVTPLASQMTLTTHGTEYFRDPEMVRQAIRGTRVSDVDAARFDLYGAGAVLYFVLEGTFPPHGVLSRFRKQSPESLRWIARRAMAEFDQRYATAEEMLRDLDHAILGGDASAVRPADLPSMRGKETDSHVTNADMIDAATVRDDGSGPRGSEATQAHEQARSDRRVTLSLAPPAPPAPPDARLRERPSIRVMNWWTGAYATGSLRPLPALPPAAEQRGIGAAAAVLLVALLAFAASVGLLTWIAAR